MTSTNDRRTKAQLLEELGEARENLKLINSRNRELERAVPAKVEVADALAGCIRALEPLATRRSGYNIGFESTGTELGSVIKHLIDRYHLDLTVRVTEPCHRQHIEDASSDDLVRALRSGPVNGFGVEF